MIRFRQIVLLIVWLSPAIARGEDREWIRTSFKASDGKYKYFVGVSEPLGNKQDAIAQARENAWSRVVSQEFSTRAKVRFESTESLEVFNAERETSVYVEVDFSELEQIDQDVEVILGDIPSYVVRSLFRYDRDKIEKQRQKIIARQEAPASDRPIDSDSNRKKAEARNKAIREREQREEEIRRLRKVWTDVFPAYGADLTLGYTGKGQVHFTAAGLALRARVIDRLYLGVFYSYGIGGDRKAEKADSSGTAVQPEKREGSARDDTDVFIRSGVDLRFYIVRNIRNGYYIKALMGLDQLHITCKKDAEGYCIAPMPKNQSGSASGGGLGVNTNIGPAHFWIEGVMVKNSNPKIGVNGSLNFGTTWGFK